MGNVSFIPARDVAKGSFLVETDGCLFEVLQTSINGESIRLELNVDNFLAIPQHVLIVKPDQLLPVFNYVAIQK